MAQKVSTVVVRMAMTMMMICASSSYTSLVDGRILLQDASATAEAMVKTVVETDQSPSGLCIPLEIAFGGAIAIAEAAASAISSGDVSATVNAAARAVASGGNITDAAVDIWAQTISIVICNDVENAAKVITTSFAVAEREAQAQADAFAGAVAAGLSDACEKCPENTASAIALASSDSDSKALATSIASAASNANVKLDPKCYPSSLAEANASSFAEATGSGSTASANASAKAVSSGGGQASAVSSASANASGR